MSTQPLSALLKRAGRGSASEEIWVALGETFEKLYAAACLDMENAVSDEALREARADYRALRRLFRRLGYDIKDGNVARREIEGGRG